MATVNMNLVKKATYFAKNHRLKGVYKIIFSSIVERIYFIDSNDAILAWVGYEQGRGNGNNEFWIK